MTNDELLRLADEVKRRCLAEAGTDVEAGLVAYGTILAEGVERLAPRREPDRSVLTESRKVELVGEVFERCYREAGGDARLACEAAEVLLSDGVEGFDRQLREAREQYLRYHPPKWLRKLNRRGMRAALAVLDEALARMRPTVDAAMSMAVRASSMPLLFKAPEEEPASALLYGAEGAVEYRYGVPDGAGPITTTAGDTATERRAKGKARGGKKRKRSPLKEARAEGSVYSEARPWTADDRQRRAGKARDGRRQRSFLKGHWRRRKAEFPDRVPSWEEFLRKLGEFT